MSGSPSFALEVLACAFGGIVLWVACAGAGYGVIGPTGDGGIGRPRPADRTDRPDGANRGSPRASGWVCS